LDQFQETVINISRDFFSCLYHGILEQSCDVFITCFEKDVINTPTAAVGGAHEKSADWHVKNLFAGAQLIAMTKDDSHKN